MSMAQIRYVNVSPQVGRVAFNFQMLRSRSTRDPFFPLAGYKLKGSLTFTDLIDHTVFANRNVTPSERGLHCFFFHWIRYVCHSILLAP